MPIKSGKHPINFDKNTAIKTNAGAALLADFRMTRWPAAGEKLFYVHWDSEEGNWVRRDWFVTGTIVVVATAFAVGYLMTAEGCDPISGVCFQTAWWGVPSLLLVIGIGAGIMLFSIASTGTSKSQEATEAKNGTEEEPLQDWTETLNELETVIQATEEKILSDQEDARARIPTAHETSTVEGEEIIASEAVAEQSHRLIQEAEDVGIQSERLLSIEGWVQEAIQLSEEIIWKEKDLVESRKSLMELEEQLRSGFEVLTAEWDSLVARDRSLLLAVRHLIGALGAGRIPLTDEGVVPPSLSPVARSEPLGSESRPGVPSVGALRVTRTDAVERMKKALQSVKVRAHTQDMPEVRNMLNLALASLKAGHFEDTVRHSEEVLEILRGDPSGP